MISMGNKCIRPKKMSAEARDLLNNMKGTKVLHHRPGFEGPSVKESSSWYGGYLQALWSHGDLKSDELEYLNCERRNIFKK